MTKGRVVGHKLCTAGDQGRRGMDSIGCLDVDGRASDHMPISGVKHVSLGLPIQT